MAREPVCTSPQIGVEPDNRPAVGVSLGVPEKTTRFFIIFVRYLRKKEESSPGTKSLSPKSSYQYPVKTAWIARGVLMVLVAQKTGKILTKFSIC